MTPSAIIHPHMHRLVTIQLSQPPGQPARQLKMKRVAWRSSRILIVRSSSKRR